MSLFRRCTRQVSPRRARAMYEAARLESMIAELPRENARCEAEMNRPCPHCQPEQGAAVKAVLR